MTEIEDWIDKGIAVLGISATKITDDRARIIVAKLRRQFVIDEPKMWWWTALRAAPIVYSTDEHTLSSVLPTLDGIGFFVPETEDGRQPVYRLSLSDVERVVHECPFFEYYVSDESFRWLVIESHHNEFYVVKEIPELST